MSPLFFSLRLFILLPFFFFCRCCCQFSKAMHLTIDVRFSGKKLNEKHFKTIGYNWIYTGFVHERLTNRFTNPITIIYLAFFGLIKSPKNVIYFSIDYLFQWFFFFCLVFFDSFRLFLSIRFHLSHRTFYNIDNHWSNSIWRKD